MAKNSIQSQKVSNGQILFLIFSVIFFMGALAYASVPLYQLFCQVTGYGGTTQRAEILPDTVLDRQITVRFNADVNTQLDWAFSPQQKSITLPIGEAGLAFYDAQNRGAEPVVGTATFNVTPMQAGPYFNKVQCFCFEEQILKAGEAMEMPVQFYVDPAIVDDPDLKDIEEITLSYTFFKSGSQDLANALESTTQQLNLKNNKTTN